MQTIPTGLPAVAAKLAPLGGFSKSTQLNLAIGLPLRNQAALSNLLQQIYDPASPNFHHYLTPEQFAEQFGPAEADYQAVVAFAKQNGLEVTATHPNRMLLDVSGTVADVERALHVTMHTYQHPAENRTFFAPNTEPTIDLATPVLQISGLNNFSLPKPRLIARQLVNSPNAEPNAGSGPGGTYLGNDFRAAYLPDSPLAGSGEAVGLLQFDGYNASDIAYYANKAGLPSITLSNVLLNGFNGNPTGSGGEVEVCLDIEMVISVATNLSKVIVYEAGPYGNWHDMLNRMATDNLAKQLSCSWYIPGGGADAVADQIWQQMAAQGQSFFNASGDDDAFTGLIDFPGDTPYITQVGGTTLTTTGPGGAWVSETVWNWGNGIGSGGGISTSYNIPSWQTNVSMAGNQGSPTKRNTPDVALTADKVYVRANNRDYNVGGTSCAAPLWAGFAALINQQAAASGRSAIGFVNPAVYAIGKGVNYSSSFHDITTGNNQRPGSGTKFPAVAGYDLCTGWGTPVGQGLINALANPEPLQITPAAGFISIGGVGGPFNVTSQTYSLTNIGTNTLTWTWGNTSVWLTASPTGGTLASGGPAATVAVNLNTAASNLVVGTYNATLWITNLNDNFGQGRSFSLSVISPPTITIQPTNQAVLEGATAAFTITATGGLPLSYQWQNNGTNLTDGGNVFGSTTAALVISNVSVANVGTYTAVLTNFAGARISSNALLTIIPSAPVIIKQPTNEMVVVQGTAQFVVAALGTKPIAYQWTFNGTNILNATNAVLTLSQVQFSQAGVYAATLTNIYGFTNSSDAVLTVTPCSPAPSGLVGWWAAEGNALDQIGGNNGTLVGNLTYGPGQVGQAFVGDGIISGVSMSNSPSLQLQNFTIEAWIKRSSTTAVANSVTAWFFGYGNNGYGLGLWNDGRLFLTKVGVDSIEGSTSITDTNFHHVAVTKNGSTVTFYVDGVGYPPLVYNTVFTFSSSMGIGYLVGNPTCSFLGTLDEVSVYNRPLSAAEIQSIYLAGSGGKCFTPAPPVITSQPTNLTVLVGQPASFSVSASGSAPLSYQWRFNGTNLVGATNKTLTLPSAQFTNAGTYSVTVSNVVNSILSSNAVLTVNSLPPCSPAPSGLVGWWAGEGNALDQIGGNTGTLAGNAGYGMGKVGQGFLLDGNGAGVSISNATTLQLQDFTIETWIQRSSPSLVSYGSGGNGTLFGYGSGGYFLGINSAGTLFFCQLGYFDYVAGPAISDTNFHHVAVTKNGSTIVFYLDGTAYTTPSYDVTFTFTGGPGIGYRPDNADNGFLGTLDEVSVYNRPLSAAEVQAIYLAGSGGKCFTPVPPVITSQPTNLTVFAGQSASFSVTASGTPPLRYQWRFSGTNLVGATNATLLLPSAQFTNAGTYSVTVSNVVNSILSSNVVLTVNSLPPCSPAPSGLVGWWAAEGNALDQIGGNNGTLVGNLTYGPGQVGQAFVGDGIISGVSMSNSPSLQLQNFTIEAWIKRSSTTAVANSVTAWFFGYGNNGYGLGLWNDGRLFLTKVGVDSIEGSTSITDTNFHHVAVTKNGSTVTFYVDGVGYPPLVYNTVFTFSSSMGIGYLVGNPTCSFLGTLDEVSVYNRPLSAAEIQSIYLAGSGGKCFTPAPPVITSQPTNLTVLVGQPASFSVSASGSAPLSYQWRFNGTNLVGATNKTLTLPSAQFTNAGTYSVTVSTPFISTISSNATLTINDKLDHFSWEPIPSPGFVNVPFTAKIKALNLTNGIFTNFVGTVAFSSTSGISINPPISTAFVQGMWTGSITISQPSTNLVLRADDGHGVSGLANAINVVSRPTLGFALSGNFLLIYWPVASSNFVLETSENLATAPWVQADSPPLLIGNIYLQSILMNNTNQFYRLRYFKP